MDLFLFEFILRVWVRTYLVKTKFFLLMQNHYIHFNLFALRVYFDIKNSYTNIRLSLKCGVRTAATADILKCELTCIADVRSFRILECPQLPPCGHRTLGITQM